MSGFLSPFVSTSALPKSWVSWWWEGSFQHPEPSLVDGFFLVILSVSWHTLTKCTKAANSYFIIFADRFIAWKALHKSCCIMPAPKSQLCRSTEMLSSQTYTMYWGESYQEYKGATVTEGMYAFLNYTRAHPLFLSQYKHRHQISVRAGHQSNFRLGCGNLTPLGQ